VKDDLVSIIIPAYNAEPYLRRAIDSVLGQTYAPIEVVVVDDGSTDGTAAICRDYGDRIIYIHQENQGVSVARNRGIQESKGELIGFLDADDWYLPNKLSDLVSLLKRHPQAGAATAAHIVKLPNEERRNPPQGCVFSEGTASGIIDLYEQRSQGRLIINSDTVLLRKSTLNSVGGFRPDLRFGEDVELWARIAGSYDWAYLDETVSVYDRTSETSVTALTPLCGHGIGFLYTNSEIKKHLRPSARRFYRKYRQQLSLQRMTLAMKHSDRAFVKACLQRALPPPFNLRAVCLCMLALMPTSVWKLVFHLKR
jgi:glycosyltransferase involved in cell wall biosynthesis